jgi:hypothetical protein
MSDPDDVWYAEMSTEQLIAVYENDDGDAGDHAMDELHRRAEKGNRQAARAVLNDSDVDEPGWTYQTGRY